VPGFVFKKEMKSMVYNARGNVDVVDAHVRSFEGRLADVIEHKGK